MPLLLNSHVDIYIVCGTMKTLATFAWSLRTGSAVSFWLINVFKTFAKRVAVYSSSCHHFLPEYKCEMMAAPSIKL